MTGPFAPIEQSHQHMGLLVNELRETIAAVQAGKRDADEARDEFLELVTALRDDLLDHFAREEEGLFPYLREHAGLGEAIAALERSHDELCGVITRILHRAGRQAPVSGERGDLCALLFARFDAEYAAHARDEAEVLRDAARRLTPEQRAFAVARFSET